ncbi:GNAT family N-acetyltransferase [Brevibacillus dissolubilis]|uniref:GNAT family N-acetyltransferase n=1 Tax=Brevibacillus dissolubilis TaxID=1844116 RepID=UPI00159BC1C5|nr:GNAT family N-acetyltransferase [Brevibacillus dissolubilis]
MLTISLIPDEKRALYQPLIPSHLQNAIVHSPHQWMVIGAEQGNQVAGIALAHHMESLRAVVLHHLANTNISSDPRKIGTLLLSQLTEESQKRGAERIVYECLTTARELHAHASLYEAVGWNPPEPSLHVWSGELRLLYEQPWVKHNRFPDSFEVFSWAELTREEREEIRQGENVWYPADLSPFPDEEMIDPRYSLGLRHLGKIAGWLIIQPKSHDTALLKILYVKRPFQRMGRGISLLAEFLQRTSRDHVFPYGIVVVEEQNKPMIHFIESHCHTAVQDTKSVYRMEKLL